MGLFRALSTNFLVIPAAPRSTWPVPPSSQHLPLMATSTPCTSKLLFPSFPIPLPPPVASYCWQPVLVLPKQGSHQPQPSWPQPHLPLVKTSKDLPGDPTCLPLPAHEDLSITCTPVHLTTESIPLCGPFWEAHRYL